MRCNERGSHSIGWCTGPDRPFIRPSTRVGAYPALSLYSVVRSWRVNVAQRTLLQDSFLVNCISLAGIPQSYVDFQVIVLHLDLGMTIHIGRICTNCAEYKDRDQVRKDRVREKILWSSMW